MKFYFILCSWLIAANTLAQTYQPDWKSLDARPVPAWFREAKFGIFIHWGVYSVPAYCTKGNYAEWYQHGLMTGDSARIKYHQAKFGKLTYYQLADQFKAELFDPEEWARLFEKSGAKYIVLTSKHHDGYCLWPSKEADRDWGFPWNASEIGPRQDLIDALFTSVRKTSVHPGLYYSLYEWYNPLWKKDPKQFAAQHSWPQMKDLVNRYHPDVFWTDGDWDAGEEVWKSKEFLAWLYNESPVKNSIVTYGRWGKGIRFNHGAVYTPEYQPDLDFEEHYFEESRGMGFSYGYNREEDAWDYNSARVLVLSLVDKVSRGGNFLLDIGPDEHGKIPPIMQERLLQIGDWMKVNGEAIYNSIRWKTPVQWSEGRRDYKPSSHEVQAGGDILLKLTVDPDPGYAVKQLFFTYNPSSNTLYAIFPAYPADRTLLLKNVDLPAGTRISFLATTENLAWKKEGNDVRVQLPVFDPEKIKSSFAFTLKISQFGKFMAKPDLQAIYQPGAVKPLISLSAAAGTIRYTTDGIEPSRNSASYQKPFVAEKTCTIKAAAFGEDGQGGRVASLKVISCDWMNPIPAKGLISGLHYAYYEPSGPIDLAIPGTMAPAQTGVTNEISLLEKRRKDKFVFLFEGYVKISQDGLYNFYLTSDDGSKLFIDDMEIVDNDGVHGAVEQSGKAALRKGFHKIKLLYDDLGGDNELSLAMQQEGGIKKALPPTVLFH